MSIKRIAPNKYQVRVNRVDPKTGHKVNRKVTIEGTKDDAQRAYVELQAEVKTTALKPSRIRLHVYAASWLAKRELRNTTRRRHAQCLAHILPAIGEYYLDSLTPEVIQDYVKMRLTAASGHTVLTELRLLRTIAKDAYAARLATMVFTDRVRAPAVSHYTKANPNRLTTEQFVAVLSRLDPHWKPMTMLLVTTGLRWGEASALHGADVVLFADGTGEATVNWNNDNGTLVEKRSRTKGMERTVPLVPEVIQLMKPLLSKAGRGPIFVSRHGTVYASPSLFGRKLQAAEKAAEIPYKVKPHGLRRTWKNIAKHHASREVLKAIGGWSTDEMLEHYDHVESSEKQAAAAAVITALNASAKGVTP